MTSPDYALYYKSFLPVVLHQGKRPKQKTVNAALKCAFRAQFDEEVKGVRSTDNRLVEWTSALMELLKYRPNTSESLPDFPDGASVTSRIFYLLHLMFHEKHAADVIGYLRVLLNHAVHVRATFPREARLIKRMVDLILDHFTFVHDLT
jgi:hypothetical protein